ncbi:MAG TPA: hypothetical protein VFF10_07215 [Trueperaceae bacterium]|nr:hypothetical protein [Trueperaceae bacterium]
MDTTTFGAFFAAAFVLAVVPTALFFLAFIPQFIDSTGNAFARFVVLGLITTLVGLGVYVALRD